MKTACFIILLFFGILWACSKKRIIVVPTACMTFSAKIVHKSDSIVISNCSEADNCFLTYGHSNVPDPDPDHVQANGLHLAPGSKTPFFFSKTGTHYFYLRVWNNQLGSPEMYQIDTVVVLP